MLDDFIAFSILEFQSSPGSLLFACPQFKFVANRRLKHSAKFFHKAGILMRVAYEDFGYDNRRFIRMRAHVIVDSDISLSFR